MRRHIYSVSIALAAAVWLFAGAARGEERGASIGTVKIDAFAAKVHLEDTTDDEAQLVLTICGIKPQNAPNVRANRIKVWLLRSNFTAGGPAMALEEYPEQPNLPERAVETGVEVQATFKFASRGLHREHMFAVVVAIDDVPQVFKITPPEK